MRQWKQIIYILIYLLSPVCARAHTFTEADTVIRNIALLTYTDQFETLFSVSSNVSVIKLSQLHGICITPDGTLTDPGRVLIIAGNPVYITYILRNTGNGPDTYFLEPVNLLDENGNQMSPILYIDRNRNGVLDPVDDVYDNDLPPVLAPGKLLSLILEVPHLLPAGQGSIFVNVVGHSNGDPSRSDEENFSRLDMVDDAVITAFESINKKEAYPGDDLALKIDFANTGMRPVISEPVLIDKDNDGTAETFSGFILSSPIPDNTELIPLTADFAPAADRSFPVYAGNDMVWKMALDHVNGTIAFVGLFIKADANDHVLEPDQEGFFSYKVRVHPNAPATTVHNTSVIEYSNNDGAQRLVTNTVFVDILFRSGIVVDDTDDNGSHTSSGIYPDEDNLMSIGSAPYGMTVSFQNEACNFGNSSDVINLIFDMSTAQNLIPGMDVRFAGITGIPLTDTDSDGLPDTGSLEPEASFSFLTQVMIPAGEQGIVYNDIVIPIKGVSANDLSQSDVTFNLIKRIPDIRVRIQVKMRASVNSQAQTGSWDKKVFLQDREIFVYEYDVTSGELLRQKKYITDANSFISYNEEREYASLHEWMRYGDVGYRIALAEDYEGFTYYPTPLFYKKSFDLVQNPGDVVEEGEVRIEILPDGMILLTMPLDPAGYVFDAVTGEKVNSACVTFYKCNTPACENYSEVPSSRFLRYPDGITQQENGQVSGSRDRDNTKNVFKGSGAFEFKFADFRAEDVGWYFIEVDFDCNFSASDPNLSDIYDNNIRLNRDKTWDVAVNDFYHGEKFYIDETFDTFPGATNMRIPLLSQDFKNLHVAKSVTPTVVSIGDFQRYTIKVKNKNTNYTVYDAIVRDNLPRSLRYKSGTATIDGAKAPDPAISSDGTVLTWQAGEILPEQELELSFYARVTSGATEGKQVNAAMAEARSSDGFDAIPIGSNVARAVFNIVKGVFTDRAYIIGKVFVDDNNNRIRDENEQGLKGIKIYMEDGRYVITDGEGNYHMDNIIPGSHVLKIDKTTLPPNSIPDVINNRNMGDPDTAFADIFPGDIFKVNFRIIPKKIAVTVDAKFAKLRGNLFVRRTIDEFLTDPSSGVINLRHTLLLQNKSHLPLYEVSYKEASPFEPIQGTVYLNGGSFKNPKTSCVGFSWDIPMIRPKEDIAITYLSELPAEGTKAEGNLLCYLHPAGEPVKIPVSLPLILTMTKPDEYSVTVYFDFDKYTLTKAGKTSLDAVVRFLRKRDYKSLYVRIEEHAAGVHVKKKKTDRLENMELSSLRNESLYNYLRKSLIDMKRVKGGRDNALLQSTKPGSITDTAVKEPGLTVFKALKKKTRFEIICPETDIIQTEKTTRVMTVIPLGASHQLLLNGMVISKERLAATTRDEKLGTEKREYVGVRLLEGENRIVLEINGKPADEKTITISENVAGIIHSIYPVRPPADGKTPAYVAIQLRDRNGNKIEENGFVIVDVDKGDLYDYETNTFKHFVNDGYRLRIVAGNAIVKLSPATTTEERRLTVSYGELEKKIDVQFYPERRPWIVVGNLEGGVGFGDQDNSPPEQSEMPFDHSRGGANYEGRAAIFAKGNLNDYSVTFRYDTRGPANGNTLMQENIPSTEEEQFYPVYGDESEQVFEARSNKKLYLKVEKDRSYALFGDYKTEFGDHLEFNKYTRTLNGGLFHFEQDKNFTIGAFISENNQSIVKERFEDLGISGPYFLRNKDLVQFSERITIEVRDRFIPNRILSEKTVSRNSDYTINYEDGWIIFHEPVKSFDNDLNPVFMQIVYETRDLAEEKYMYGVRAEKEFFDGRLTVGVLGTMEEHPEKDKVIYGADIIYDDNETLKIVGEITETENIDTATLGTASGRAGRIEATYSPVLDTKLHAHYKKVENGFQNLSANSAERGYETYGIACETALNEKKTKLRSGIVVDNDNTLDRTTAEAEVEQKITEKLQTRVGVKWNREDTDSDGKETTLATAGISYHPTEKLGITLVREQSLTGETESDFHPAKTMAQISYKLFEEVTTSIKTELTENADRDVFTTSFGIDSRIGENTTAFSKYTLDDSVSGWRNQAHLGVNHQFLILDGFTLDAGIEHVHTLSGDARGDYLATRFGLTYLQKDNYKLSGKGEARFNEEDTEYLFSFGGTVKIKRNSTILARARYFDSDYTETNFLLGWAYRPISSDRLNYFTKFRWKQNNRDSTDNTRYIGSWHINYQPFAKSVFMGEYAAKYVDLSDVGHSFTDLVRFRIIYDINKRFDCNVHAGILRQCDTSTFLLAWGPEIGLKVMKNFWVSIGYNFSGFYDNDFEEANYWARGFYFKLRIKFDEKALFCLNSGGDGEHNVF